MRVSRPNDSHGYIPILSGTKLRCFLTFHSPNEPVFCIAAYAGEFRPQLTSVAGMSAWSAESRLREMEDAG